MLNREQLHELAQFKVLLRQHTGISVKIDALIHDLDYQQHMLEQAEDHGDEALLMAALVLRSRLGLLEAKSTVPPTAPVQEAWSAPAQSAAPAAGGVAALSAPKPVAASDGATRYTLSLR